MNSLWLHLGPTFLAAFLASLVECVEALTIVLAVGAMRGWREALSGCVTALVLIGLIIAVFGKALANVPITVIQIGVGALLLLFGLRWLRKAILRAAGVIPLHDEEKAYRDEERRLGSTRKSGGFDKVAWGTAFQITMLEGAEVVFIVLGVGAGSAERLQAGSWGAVAALLVVAAIGTLVHRPLARVPENQMKFVVGVLLAAFGAFWFGEGIGLAWPGEDWSLVWLTIGFFAAAVVGVRLCAATGKRPLNAAGRSA